MKSEPYNKFGYGLFVLKSKNSLFNADFSHEPRQLPDANSTFYATDKSLKYCIRRYVHDIIDKKDKMVFFWRRNTKGGNAMNIAENYEHLFGKKPEKRDTKKEDDDANLKAQTNLLTCWDVRVFGATFAEEGCNVSITGPIQITYGVNKISDNPKYSSQILSPFKPEKEAEQRTIGSESKALEAHLVFDFIINPHTLPSDISKLTEEDVALFKEALCKGVSYVNSAAKIGSESEFALYFESPNQSTLPLLKDLLTLEVFEGKTKIDLKRMTDALSEYNVENVEIYYEPSFVEVKNAPKSAKSFNIHTLKKLKAE
jgi:CRISPR-associated protein Csh2